MEKHGTMTSDNHAALWHGRFKEGPDAAAVAFETSIFVDERMAFDDIQGSIAHAKMLSHSGIISEEESNQIVKGLESIKNDLENGILKIDYSAEDIHSFIEATLTDRVGEPGKKVHTGRSRNDQIALDERLYLRRTIPEIQNSILRVIDVLVKIAEENKNSLIPGFTHMQHAQPVTLAHHVCAWAWMFVRDWQRLEDSLKRINISPIGCCALAGSGLPLDREYEAKLLGFEKVTQNSLDTVSDRDYCIEVANNLSLIQMHLSRACEEIVLWATTEFSFVDLSEKWSTGSSIMPQKKNPDFAELIRGRTGKVYGNEISLLTMMKGLPLSYDRDMQEDKEPLFNSIDTVSSCLKVFAYMIETAKWNTENMEKACKGGFLNATDVADYLVKKGMPFRTAHGVSAKAVRIAIENNCELEDLTINQWKECSDLIEDDILLEISSRACVNARKTIGGPAPEMVENQICELKKFCENKK